jgi:hypothetical protein
MPQLCHLASSEQAYHNACSELASIVISMTKKPDTAKPALQRAAEAARKVMRRHGYDLPEEDIKAAYLQVSGSMKANIEPQSAQKLGGEARAQALSAKRRSEIARAAAQARWQAKKPAKKGSKNDE